MEYLKLNFLSLKVLRSEELKEYLNLFLKEWKKFYPDQIKTHIETLTETKKIHKLEAMKKFEEEITSQFNFLINTFQSFPDPFKIYTFWEISGKHGFLKNHKGDEDLSVLSGGEFPEFWTWDKDFYGPPNNQNVTDEYKITGIAYKEYINWSLTLLKNCELAYGLEEKEVILFQDKKIQIIQIEGDNFLKVFPREKREIN